MTATIDNRDSDIPVVLFGFRLRRSHHHLGLIKRDRHAIVTKTFVNGHIVLPSLTKSLIAGLEWPRVGQANGSERSKSQLIDRPRREPGHSPNGIYGIFG